MMEKQQVNQIDVRTRHHMSNVRGIIRSYMELLEKKDTPTDLYRMAYRLVDDLTLDQLNKIRNVRHNICKEIIAIYGKGKPSEEH